MDDAAIFNSGHGDLAPTIHATLAHQLLDAAAIRDPSAVALYDSDGPCSYAELSHEAGKFTQWLLDRDIQRGDRIAVDAVPDRRFVAMLYGGLAASALLVPVSCELTAPERNYQLSDAEATLIVSSRSSSAQLDRITLSAAEIWDQLPESPAAARSTNVSLSDAALLIYTSGSTSRPKGVLCRHAQVAYAVSAIGSRLGYRAEDIVFTRLPLSFDYGLYQVFLCADAGAAIAFSSRQSDARLLAEIAAVGATVVPVVPALAEMLIALSERRTGNQTIRLFTNTGERLESGRIVDLRNRFPGAAVQLMYGLTECKRVSIGEPDGDLKRPGSVGRPLDGTAVAVVDPSGAILPPHAVGELIVTGPHVMDGYWRAPIPTRKVFWQDAENHTSLHTGDWGYLDNDGYIYLSGRRDDQFKSRGVRTSVSEIEEASNTIPGVRKAVLLPPRGATQATLCVVSDLAPEVVLRHLRETLESAKVPRLCHVFESFPLSSNGKVDRTKLAKWVRS